MTTWVRKSFRVGLAALAAAALITTAPKGQARDGIGDIVRVEQDWEIVVGAPNPTQCSPQLFIMLYPVSGGDYSCQFLVNYADQPSFSAGGVQLQIWQSNTVLDGHDNCPNQAILQQANETVTFTLSMQISGSNLEFKAQNVSSPSFGDIANLDANVSYDPTATFNNYSSADSVNNSGILYGANRVASLTLKQVRKYDANGNMVTEDAQQVFP
jgi:hypothetical protein